ncbi:MAG: prolyl oligopeptidase family serine peptidase [Pirellulaceae bacterium]|nr:prolyl oligopeptidase family serine peptidase [Pirellulaceae bacterium]
MQVHRASSRLVWSLVAFGFWNCFAISGSELMADQPAAGKQVEQQLVVGDAIVGYQLFLPPGYGEQEKRWPLMLFLHGRGESNGPLSLVKKWGPPLLVDTNPEFPFILVSPQCPREDAWNRPTQQKLLVALLDDIAKRYQVDPDRVYLTGLSMGGYGSWTLAAAHPDRFAAVAPICGGGNAEDASRLKDLPIWVFHGDQDRAVPIERSQAMVEAIKQAGGERIRFTTLEHVGHNSWSAAYATPELYEWFLGHQRAAPASQN